MRFGFGSANSGWGLGMGFALGALSSHHINILLCSSSIFLGFEFFVYIDSKPKSHSIIDYTGSEKRFHVIQMSSLLY